MLRQALALTLLSGPALALDCTPQTSCTIEGSCSSGATEGAIRLTRTGDRITLTSLPEPAPGEPPLHLIETPRDDTTLRSFFTATSPAGDAVLLTLLDERHFTLSIHGHARGTPYAFLTEGSCEGSL